jgi:alkylation response protein AidB-like acyl-CoA dehydrogenase
LRRSASKYADKDKWRETMILSEDHQTLKTLFREFAEKEFTAELLNELDETGEFNREILNKMAESGFTGVKIPEDYSGQGGDSLAYCLMIEEFARVSPVLSVYANTSNSLGAGPLLICGNENQKQEYLPPIARGEKILVFGLTEPDAGSDAGGIRTTATEDGDAFILNGRKCFTSGAPIADHTLIFARTDPTQKGSRGISMFIVDMSLPGVSCGKHEEKMGIRGYPTSDVILEDTRVPKDCLIGPLHNGYIAAMKTLDGGRLGMAAQAVGIAQGCLDQSVEHAKVRKQFGQPIGNFQAISFMLAEMAAEIEAARQLVYHTALVSDTGDPEATKLCSMSKFFAAEMCNRCAYKAVQIHGGYGFIKEYKVERFYRDARISTLYEGTSQVQQIVIARSLLKGS